MVFGPALTRLRQKLFLSAFANQTHSVDFVRLHFTTSLWIADGEETSEVQPRRFSVVKLLTKSIECPFDIFSYKMPSTHIHTHVQLKYVIKTLTEKNMKLLLYVAALHIKQIYLKKVSKSSNGKMPLTY